MDSSGSVLLCDRDLALRLLGDPSDRDTIVVLPLLDMSEQLGPASLDVRLGTEFRIFQRQLLTHLDPFADERDLADIIEKYAELVPLHHDPIEEMFVLHPGEFVLASTLEYVRLPRNVAARMEGRSSWGRIGLQVHSTASFINPGYEGSITYELSNLGTLPIPLFPGLRVAQLTFYEVREPMEAYGDNDQQRKYQWQLGTTASRFFRDREIRKFRPHMRHARARGAIPDMMELVESLGEQVSAEEKAVAVKVLGMLSRASL